MKGRAVSGLASPRRERPLHYGFTLIELMIVVAILGLLASIALPSMMKWMRRSKTAEAKVQLAKMFDATASYFHSEHVERGSVATISSGGSITNMAPHRCPYYPGEETGDTSSRMTPDLSLNCNDGPGGRCVPSDGGSDPGFYSFTLWTDNNVWHGLQFQMEQAHFFHYNFNAYNSASGHGACQFTAQAFADLDDDGLFSTFERAGAADVHGTNAAFGLYLDQEVE